MSFERHSPDCCCGHPECPGTVHKTDFSCRVCGKECSIAPDPPERAVCEEHCEDHNYEHDPSRGSWFCTHCDKEAPTDFYVD